MASGTRRSSRKGVLSPKKQASLTSTSATRLRGGKTGEKEALAKASKRKKAPSKEKVAKKVKKTAPTRDDAANALISSVDKQATLRGRNTSSSSNEVVDKDNKVVSEDNKTTPPPSLPPPLLRFCTQVDLKFKNKTWPAITIYC